MTPEQQAAYIIAQSVCAVIEMQSMIVANHEREQQGKAFAYSEEAFLQLLDKYGLHHNSVLTAFGG